MYGVRYDCPVYVNGARLVYGEPADDWVITADAGEYRLNRLNVIGRYEVKYTSHDAEYVMAVFQEVKSRTANAKKLV